MYMEDDPKDGGENPMSQVTVLVPYVNYEDEKIHITWLDLFPYLLNKEISKLTRGDAGNAKYNPTLLKTPRHELKRNVTTQYDRLDSLQKTKIQELFIANGQQKQIEIRPDIHEIIRQYREDSAGKIVDLTTIGFYTVATSLAYIKDKDEGYDYSSDKNFFNHMSTLDKPSTELITDNPITKPLTKSLIKKLLDYNSQLWNKAHEYIHYSKTILEFEEGELRDAMIDFCTTQIETVRKFQIDMTGTYTTKLGVVFKNPNDSVRVPMLHFMKQPRDGFVPIFEPPVGTSKISTVEFNRKFDVATRSFGNVTVASLPLDNLITNHDLDFFCLNPYKSYQSGIGIYANGSTGQPDKETYKKIMAVLEEVPKFPQDHFENAIHYLKTKLGDVFFFNNTDKPAIQRAKYMMSLIMLRANMPMHDIEFSNMMVRNVNTNKSITISYSNKSPQHIMCWFIVGNNIYLVQIKICFQEFGRDLFTILKSRGIPIKDILTRGYNHEDIEPTYDNSHAADILARSLFSYKNQRDELLYPIIQRSIEAPNGTSSKVHVDYRATGGSNQSDIVSNLSTVFKKILINQKITKVYIFKSKIVEKFRTLCNKFFETNPNPELDEFIRFIKEIDGIPELTPTIKAEIIDEYENLLKKRTIPGNAGMALNLLPPDPREVMREPAPSGIVAGMANDNSLNPLHAASASSCECSIDETSRDVCHIRLEKKWAMLIETMFIMDKLHDCASTRLKKIGFGDKIELIHNSLIDRIKTKLLELLKKLNPHYDRDPSDPKPASVDPENVFIYRFCFVLFSYFKTNFNSGNYEATILTFLIACLKTIHCKINIKSNKEMMTLISKLKCVVVNNAVMGKPPTNHPFTYRGQPDTNKSTVTVCTPGGTYTDGGTVFEKWPVYVKPKDIYVYYEEDSVNKSFMKLCYQEMRLPEDDLSEDEIIHLFDEFLKVCICDTKTGFCHSYPINPMRKVHNKMVVADELSKGYFSGSQPFTDKKGLCDFLQHFLLLAAECKEDVCFAVYQNDLMSVIFHILTMISICESGALGTAVNCITAVLYCPLRVLVFRIISNRGASSSSSDVTYSYELDCVGECRDDTIEDEDGDFDVDDPVAPNFVNVPTNPTNGSGGGIPTSTSVARGPMFGGKTRKLKLKSIRKKKSRYIGRHIGGAAMKDEDDPAVVDEFVETVKEYPDRTPPFIASEVFNFIKDYMSKNKNDPRSLFLALKYKYYKTNRLTTETLEEFIQNENAPSLQVNDTPLPKIIEVNPNIFRDREFLFYRYLKLWMDDDMPEKRMGPLSRGKIEEYNKKIDDAFEMEYIARKEQESGLLSMVSVEENRVLNVRPSLSADPSSVSRQYRPRGRSRKRRKQSPVRRMTLSPKGILTVVRANGESSKTRLTEKQAEIIRSLTPTRSRSRDRASRSPSRSKFSKEYRSKPLSAPKE